MPEMIVRSLVSPHQAPLLSFRASAAAPAPVEADGYAGSVGGEEPSLLTPGSVAQADLGDGFPSAEPDPRSFAWVAHDLAANLTPHTFGFAIGLVLRGVSEITEQGTGLHVSQLVDAERALYRTLVPSRQGHVGGAPPIFQALAEGQAAYVALGPEDAYDADHLTRLYSGLPPEKLIELGPGNDRMTPVREVLLDRISQGDFPAYVNVDGDLGKVTATESIVVESISSIARKENELSTGLTDPTLYYRWLVTRVESAYRRVDPWMYHVNPELHEQVAAVKDHLTPAWITQPTADPLGWIPSRGEVQSAYQTMMEVAGKGERPKMETLTNYADAAVCLDRDLLFGTQTYWMKLLREVSPDQRETLLAPLARSWTVLNLVPPHDPSFPDISPENAPNIELYDKRTKQVIVERYDRSMSLSEVVDHTLDGLGIEARRDFLNLLKQEITSRSTELMDRELRVQALMGDKYRGLDVRAILEGRLDGSDHVVQQGLDDLRRALEEDGKEREMTTRRAEILRHADMLDWLANHKFRYGNPALELLESMPGLGDEPLILGEYYQAEGNVAITPLPPGPSAPEVLGKAQPGREALPVSIVLQGGGGKGFAYAEALRQLKDGMAQADGQVAIDRYAGNSAGALTAGLLAAGYTPDELAQVLDELDFKKFYADYLWLGGGVDPEVRGVDRTGMFTMRQMYDTLTQLLKRKVPVTGRPVLFRDLPVDLRVTSTVLNANLPEDLREQLGVGEDGLVVFSSKTTPNMDVAAAMCASAAIPVFFNAPQLQVARREGGEPTEYRMQMMDGGVVNNFPVDTAFDREEDPCLVSPPVYYEAPGDPPVRLSTLNFDPADLAVIDQYNAKRYKEFAPEIGEFLQRAKDEGKDRAVLALRLATPSSQPKPLVQGRDRRESKELRKLAEQAGLDTLSEKAARKQMRSAFTRERGWLSQRALHHLLDKGDTLQPSLCHGPSYHPGSEEAVDIADVLIGAAAAQTVGSHHVDERMFER